MTIERIDNNRGYEPSNVRWATYAEQNANRRGCRYVTINGVTLLALSWAKRNGIATSALRSRIRNGWDLVRAVTEPALWQVRNGKRVVRSASPSP